MNVIGTVTEKLRRSGLRATVSAIVRHAKVPLKRHQYNSMLKKATLRDRFSTAYRQNLWGSKESGSGGGSELVYTEAFREWLVDRLPKLNVKVFVDAPCGDFNWMKTVLPRFNINYFGFDIVEAVVRRNNKLYGADNVKFSTANICTDRLPSCDILMVRDCLFHLSADDIDKFLKNISSVDFRYLLVSSHLVEDGHENLDIVSGDFRPLDLFSSPLNFDKTSIVDRIVDGPKGQTPTREMVLIEKKDVPIAIKTVA